MLNRSVVFLAVTNTILAVISLYLAVRVLSYPQVKPFFAAPAAMGVCVVFLWAGSVLPVLTRRTGLAQAASSVRLGAIGLIGMMLGLAVMAIKL